jgi:ABC-type antimicrobial peptide transport system permease subunit
MELADLVALVGRLRATTKKTEKVALIAALLQQAREREIELLALYLTGTLAQGRIGIGYRGLQAAMPSGPAFGEPLTLAGLDEALSELAKEQGADVTFVHVTDPVAYLSSLVVIIVACLFAAWIPASRAAKVDPMKTLRQE